MSTLFTYVGVLLRRGLMLMTFFRRGQQQLISFSLSSVYILYIYTSWRTHSCCPASRLPHALPVIRSLSTGRCLGERNQKRPCLFRLWPTACYYQRCTFVMATRDPRALFGLGSWDAAEFVPVCACEAFQISPAVLVSKIDLFSSPYVTQPSIGVADLFQQPSLYSTLSPLIHFGEYLTVKCMCLHFMIWICNFWPCYDGQWRQR